MDQRVVIGPTRDAVEPGGEEQKFIVAKILRLFLEQENSHHLFFKNAAREKLVGDLHYEIHSPFASDAAPEAHRKFPKLGCVPAARLYYFLEKILDVFRVRRRPAILQHAPDVVGNVVGSDFAFGHVLLWWQRTTSVSACLFARRDAHDKRSAKRML